LETPFDTTGLKGVFRAEMDLVGVSPAEGWSLG
jgi:hypothetical protein